MRVMPVLSSMHRASHPAPPHPPTRQAPTTPQRMDASSRSLPHLAEYDSFFFDESSGRLVHSVGHSFRISTSSPSFIDLYPDDLFTIFLSSPATSDFDFDLHPPVVDDAPPSPMLQTNASRIFHDGRLLPCEPGGGSCAEEDGDDPVTSQHHSADVPSAPWSSAFSSPSTPVPRSPCSTAASKHARPRPTTLCAGRRRAGSSPWKVLRFVMPLYRKVRAIARRHSSRFTLAASPARGATSSVACHGRAADTDVHDAILYCKKSSGSGVQETNSLHFFHSETEGVHDFPKSFFVG